MQPFILRERQYSTVDFVYTGFYETDLDKVALVVESMKKAKEILVTDNGIGEDLNINIFGWKNNELAVIVQLKNTHKIEKDTRLESIMDAACILRRGWAIDEFTFAAEGYCSLKPAETKNHDLAKLFAVTDSPVKECLSFTHIRSDDHLFISVPYSLNLGKNVSFGDALWYPGGQVMRDITYPAALKAALQLEAVPIDNSIDKETYFGTLASGVMNAGFEVYYRDDM